MTEKNFLNNLQIIYIILQHGKKKSIVKTEMEVKKEKGKH